MEKPVKRINVAIKDDLHREVKIRAAETRRTVTEIVEAALRLFLEQELKEAHRKASPVDSLFLDKVS